MEANNEMRDHIFGIIENQLKDNDPPETKKTFDRLRKQGFDDFVTKQLIGQCITVEIFDALTSGKPFDNKRYVKNLKALPKEPFD